MCNLSCLHIIQSECSKFGYMVNNMVSYKKYIYRRIQLLLRKLKVTNKENIVIDVDVVENEINDAMQFSTLVLGENGVGKSFFLKTVVDIFIYLEKALNQNRKPKYEYSSFEIEYMIDKFIYRVERISGKEIRAYKDDIEISYKDIRLPSKTLAVSFMVNDKFVFSKNEKGRYKYLGVRSSTNSTYTSSVSRKMIENLVAAINNNKLSSIKKILLMIGFEEAIEFEYEIKYKNIKKRFPAESLHDMEELAGLLENLYGIRVFFTKKGEKITFDNCSSGEKHILFAFFGLLNLLEDDSLILIDEPEISLHPEWQIKYITQLKEIFKEYKSCHYILASHSHYFVSDLPEGSSSIIIFRHSDSSTPVAEILPYSTYAWSAENIIYNVFGLRTTRNYYFEKDMGNLILALSNRTEKKDLNEIKRLTEKLSKYSLGEADPLNNILNKAEALIECSQDA